jgi:hypothetical protein
MARRVFIVWANPLFFDTLRLLLAQSEIEVVGESSAYEQAPGEIEKLTGRCGCRGNGTEPGRRNHEHLAHA